MRFILRLVFNALIALGAAYLLPNFFIESFWWALAFALILGILNAIIGPIIRLLTLPLTVLTLGLFALVINAILVWLTVWLLPGVEIVGFWTTVLAAIIIWIGSWIVNFILKDK